MSAPAWTIYESPLGTLTLLGSSGGVAALRFPGHAGESNQGAHRPILVDTGVGQLDEYFDGKRQAFQLPLALDSTPFQRRVWQQLQQIPYATTISYTRLARALGRPDRVRAVAAAVGRTPIPIIVACHRAVAVNGALTGYLGGLNRKRALLDLEQRGAGIPQTAWALQQTTLI